MNKALSFILSLLCCVFLIGAIPVNATNITNETEIEIDKTVHVSPRTDYSYSDWLDSKYGGYVSYEVTAVVKASTDSINFTQLGPWLCFPGEGKAILTFKVLYQPTEVYEFEYSEYTICFYSLEKFGVYFDMNGGDGKNFVLHGDNGTTNNALGKIQVPNKEYTRDGYLFAGWSTSKENGLINSLVRPGETTSVLFSGKVLYAVWYQEFCDLIYEPNADDVKFIPEAQTQLLGEFTVTDEVPVRDGYTFLGWSTENGWNNTVEYVAGDKLILERDFNLYAVWQINDYTVTFDPNGGECDTISKVITYKDKYGDLPLATKKGYTFMGWYDDSSSYHKVTENTTFNETEDIVLYAKWKANSYTLNFELNGGTCSSQNKQIFFDSSYGTLPTPSKEGYVFSGWYAEQQFINEVNENTIVEKNYNHKIYARWKKLYKITYNANGGTNTPKETIGNGEVNITDVIPTKDGYRFMGWTPNLEFTYNPFVPGEKYELTKDMTFYAIWEKIIYFPKLTIRTPSRTTVNYGDSLTLHADLDGELPDGYKIKWIYNGNFSIGYSNDGKTCIIHPETSGETMFTARIVHEESEEPAYDLNGNCIEDSIVMTSNAGFFQKIIAFFKGLFGLNRSYPESFVKID